MGIKVQNQVIVANNSAEAHAKLLLSVPDAREIVVTTLGTEKGSGNVPTGKHKFLVYYRSLATADAASPTQITVNVDPITGVHGPIDVA